MQCKQYFKDSTNAKNINNQTILNKYLVWYKTMRLIPIIDNKKKTKNF